MSDLKVYREAIPEHYDLIANGIISHNRVHTGEAHGKQLTVLARQQHEVIGGLWGEVFWSWLKVELLWVREVERGRGLGRQILREAESEARKDGAVNAFLDTFSFQALNFYEKEGYEIFGELPDFPLGHTRYFLRKHLV